MKNSSMHENATQPPIAANTLRVEYSIKVTGAAGPFMDYDGRFDLPYVFEARELELNQNLYSTMIERLVSDGSSRCFGRLLRDHVTQALAAQAQAAEADQPASAPHSTPLATWLEEFARPGGGPTPPDNLGKPDDDCLDPQKWAAYERRLADWKHSQEVMGVLNHLGKKNPLVPQQPTAAPIRPPVPQPPVTPHAAARANATSTPPPSAPLRGDSLPTSPPKPAEVAAAAPPKGPRKNSETAGKAFAPDNCVPPLGAWDAPPLAQAA